MPPPFVLDGIRPTASSSAGRVSTILIENLHCSSCVRTIEETLSSLSPSPTNVQISIVAQTVSFHHPPDLAMTVVKNALDEAGFDIVEENPATVSSSATPMGMTLARSMSRLAWSLGRKREKHAEQCLICHGEHDGHSHDEKNGGLSPTETITNQAPLIPSKPFTTLSSVPSETYSPSLQSGHDSSSLRVSISIGGMTCSACSTTLLDAVSPLPGVSDVSISVLDHSACFVVTSQDIVSKVVEAIKDCGYEADVADVRPLMPVIPSPVIKRLEDDRGPQHVTISIGGMTCASCSNAITERLSQIAGVSDVAVNLLGNSASATVSRHQLIYAMLEAIDDLGYEGDLVASEPIHRLKEKPATGGPRNISLRVDGMFCSHCPEKVTAALSTYSSRNQVTILRAPTIDHPILELSYTPSPPLFTIRTIIGAIASSRSADSSFDVTVHKPLTLEERTRRMHAREQRSLLLRLVFSVVVAIPTFIIGIVYMSLIPKDNATRMWFMAPIWTGNASRMEWALFMLATPVMFYSAGLFHLRSLKEIRALWRRRNPTPIWKRFLRFGSMNLLVSCGVSVAYFSSVVLLALAASQEPSMMGEGDTTTYFDSVVLLAMFLLIGRFLEAYSKGRTADAITALGKLRPSSALVLVPFEADLHITHGDLNRDVEKGDDDVYTKPGLRVQKIDAELLEVGDIVRVLNGSTPPADGTVLSPKDIIMGGEVLTIFDESSLTGESKPVKKLAGDKVFLGTINKGNVVDMRVEAVGGESMLDHIVSVVREGQTKRAPIERVADLITSYFVPVITLLAISTWVIWLALGLSGALPRHYLDVDVGGWPVWSLEFAIAVFVVACPCGIGLAAPTALLVGSGLAAKFGILARGGGEAFQETAQLDLVVFDKTGTLTEGGEPKVTDAQVINGALPSEVVLGIALEIEGASGHPLATAIRRYCEDSSAAPQDGSAFEETPGRGLKARFDSLGLIAVIGNEAWIDAHGAAIGGATAEKLERWKAEGKSVILLALRDVTASAVPPFTLAAVFAVADPVRSEAKPVLAKLQQQGLAVWMLSGDNLTTAKAVARMVGIPETNVIAGVLPHEKADKVRWLQQVGPKKRPSRISRLFGKQDARSRCIVAMVGDGINDAPALTAADVGIAIGSGSDVAISSAAFILVTSNLRSLLVLCDLSRTVFRRVKLNFLWASLYNLLALPIAAGVIYPAGGARLDPVWASLAMALSSVSVVCSSLLLKLYKEPKLDV